MFQTEGIPAQKVAESAESAQEALQSLKGLSLDDAITKIANGLVDFSFKLVIAILVFYAGKFIIGKLYKVVHNIMTRRKVDPSLTTFVLSLVNMVLYFILIVTIIGILGLETSSFLAIFASAGVAIGMALSGTLQNFAGGVLILLLKPYKVGDFIETQGYSGKVKAIQIFNTVINTPDNKTIIIPNGGLSTGTINNYSSEDYRRVDWTVSLSYDTDLDKAIDAIKDILASDDRIVKDRLEDDRRQRILEGKISEHQSEEEIDAIQHEDEVYERPKTWFGRIFESKRHKIRRLHNESILKSVSVMAETDNGQYRPFVGLNEMADSSINLAVRAWTNSSDYWNVYFDMNRKFFTELPKSGFSFPFPQLDVHFDPK